MFANNHLIGVMTLGQGIESSLMILLTRKINTQLYSDFSQNFLQVLLTAKPNWDLIGQNNHLSLWMNPHISAIYRTQRV